MANRSRPTRREDFHVAIICALPGEADATTLLFTEFYDNDGDPFGRAAGDNNLYTTGRIGDYNVVLLDLAGMGTNSATAAATGLRTSYGSIKLVLIVGVCGGVPKIEDSEVILGDVVISKTIKQYDYGRQYPQGFQPKDGLEDTLGRAPKDVRNLLALLTTEFERTRLQEKAMGYLVDLQRAASQKRRRANYGYPGTNEDRLFRNDYFHVHRSNCSFCSEGSFCRLASKTSCAALGCDQSELVPRSRLSNGGSPNEPDIFIGSIASGNTVLKSGEERDRISKELDVVAFEMEGAGVWDELPCLVIKGICDYADSHKNKKWQSYAAATAAAVAKAVLQKYILHDDLHPQSDHTGSNHFVPES